MIQWCNGRIPIRCIYKLWCPFVYKYKKQHLIFEPFVLRAYNVQFAYSVSAVSLSPGKLSGSDKLLASFDSRSLGWSPNIKPRIKVIFFYILIHYLIEVIVKHIIWQNISKKIHSRALIPVFIGNTIPMHLSVICRKIQNNVVASLKEAYFTNIFWRQRIIPCTSFDKNKIDTIK